MTYDQEKIYFLYIILLYYNSYYWRHYWRNKPEKDLLTDTD